MEIQTPNTDHHISGKASPNFWAAVAQRFRKNKLAKIALRFVLFLTVVAIFADFIAYKKPIVCKMNDEVYFPIVYDYLSDLGLYQWEADLIHAEWKTLDYEWSLWPPVRYAPAEIDYDNSRPKSPFGKQNIDNWKNWHYFGTNDDGRDILSGLIHGTRISLTIGLVAMGIAFFIGIILGAIAGYWGDNRLQLTNGGIIFASIGGVLGFFYAFQVRSDVLADSISSGAIPFLFQLFISILIFIVVVFLMIKISKPLNRIPWLSKLRYIWVDIIISRFIEIVTSIPAILLVITLVALSEKKSIYTVMVIIGLIGWPGIARYMRAEMLRIRTQEYVLAARSLGFREVRIIFKHALPNALAPVLVAFAFGIAGAIVLEAALSFLGIGVPDNIVTWGGMLSDAKGNLNFWWMSVFPGTVMFLTVTCLNLLGDGLRDALDPKTDTD